MSPCSKHWQDNHDNEACCLSKLDRDIFQFNHTLASAIFNCHFSSMEDGPKSIDPIILSSCVVLEDETSETQVDGIVTNVSERKQTMLVMILMSIYF